MSDEQDKKPFDPYKHIPLDDEGNPIIGRALGKNQGPSKQLPPGAKAADLSNLWARHRPKSKKAEKPLSAEPPMTIADTIPAALRRNILDRGESEPSPAPEAEPEPESEAEEEEVVPERNKPRLAPLSPGQPLKWNKPEKEFTGTGWSGELEAEEREKKRGMEERKERDRILGERMRRAMEKPGKKGGEAK